MNNAWFYAFSHLKKRIAKETEESHSSIEEGALICNFVNTCLQKGAKSKVSGKFDRACEKLSKILELFNETVKPYLGKSDEWLAVITGLEAGLLIAKTQLDFIKKGEG